MKPEFLYLILRADGHCARVAGGTTESIPLPDLLAEGWQPVRETSFGDGRILILLEREREEKFGFGFGTS